MRAFEDCVFVSYSEITRPPAIYCVRFLDTNAASLDALLAEDNIETKLVEQLTLDSPAQGDDFHRFYAEQVAAVQHDYVNLDNGAEALFMRPGNLDPSKKHPMLLVIHGGPFSASPYHLFLAGRHTLLMQGFCLLIVNYRGSIGYGEDCLNTLLGTIGENDAQDCGNLTKKALEQFSDIIDPERLGVFGGSHGGFLTGHMIGQPEFKDMWKAASLWNPVLDMTYMVNSTDIPDWIFACCGVEELDFNALTPERKVNFFNRSPMAYMQNVTTPA